MSTDDSLSDSSDALDPDSDILPVESTLDDVSHVEIDDDFDDEFDIDFDNEVDENLASFEAELNHEDLSDPVADDSLEEFDEDAASEDDF